MASLKFKTSNGEWIRVSLPGGEGKDGITPHIGENGNWYIGTNDTGVKASIEGFIETDPTVPAWAKEETKPTYTASEVGAAEQEHSHEISNVTGLQTVLDGKASASHTHTASSVGAAPAYTYGTTDLTAGSSYLETGKLYFVYE